MGCSVSLAMETFAYIFADLYIFDAIILVGRSVKDGLDTFYWLAMRIFSIDFHFHVFVKQLLYMLCGSILSLSNFSFMLSLSYALC